MKIARFQKDRAVAHGVVQGSKIIEIRGSIYRRFRTTDYAHNLKDVQLLAPTEPVQIWQPGMNFAAHLAHAAAITGIHDLPKTPQPWVKGRNSLNHTGGDIVIPKDSGGDVHYEGEAVAVIGRECRRVTEKEAPDYILGYTCGNDVSERAWQKADNFMWRAKGSDTFCPVGPWIETEVDAGNLEMVVKLNGKEVQRACTKDMLFSFAKLVSYISQQATLYPGDLVFSGTTGATSRMKPGDTVEVAIDGIGVLQNPIVAEK